MEKTIQIGNVEVNLKATARNLLLYRAAFGEDMLKAAGKLFKLFKPVIDEDTGAILRRPLLKEDGTLELDENGRAIYEGQPVYEVDYEQLDGVGMARLIWCMARTADNNIPVFDVWMDQFESFPVMDLMNDVYDLIMVNMKSISPIKNKNAAAGN